MSEIAILAGLATTGSAATYVAWPFLTGKVSVREYIEAGPEEKMRDRLVYLEERAYAALLRLDAERGGCGTSPQAYESERKRLQKLLRLISRHLEALRTGRLPSDKGIADLEDEILSGDEDRAEVVLEVEDAPPETEPYPPARTNAKAPPRRRSTSTALMCPVCGHAEEEAEAVFCVRCGTSLTCPSCGQPSRDPEAAFCSRCGGFLRPGGGKRKR